MEVSDVYPEPTFLNIYVCCAKSSFTDVKQMADACIKSGMLRM